MALIINDKKCIACGICVKACPVKALQIVNELSVVDESKCIKCGKCVRYCPALAIELEGYLKPKNIKPKKVFTAKEAEAISSGVWVLIKHSKGNPSESSWDLLIEARKKADQLNTELAAVILGENINKIIPDCFAWGADTVYVIDSPVLKEYQADLYSQALNKLIKDYYPKIVLSEEKKLRLKAVKRPIKKIGRAGKVIREEFDFRKEVY